MVSFGKKVSYFSYLLLVEEVIVNVILLSVLNK